MKAYVNYAFDPEDMPTGVEEDEFLMIARKVGVTMIRTIEGFVVVGGPIRLFRFHRLARKV